MDMVQTVLMGLGIVFIVLITIIILCKIMSAIIGSFSKQSETKVEVAPKAAAPVVATKTTDNNELIAVIGTAVAEAMGTHPSRIKIHSIKKI